MGPQDIDAADAAGAEQLEPSLTVAAVAARLGVAASTLRTWDRRYGLGPSGRSAGSHRRYSPDDLARLETMRALTERGVALGDAARMALRSTPGPASITEDLDPLSLAAAAVDADHDRLVRTLHAPAAAIGVVETLISRVSPALEILADSSRPDAPGRDPVAALTAAMLVVVRERAGKVTPDPRLGQVLVVASRGQALAAHVLAGALHEGGVRARVVKEDDDEAVAHRRCGDGVILVIELHEVQHGPQQRSECTQHDLLLVGPAAPNVPGAFRVRTIGAALHEALDLVRARSVSHGAV